MKRTHRFFAFALLLAGTTLACSSTTDTSDPANADGGDASTKDADAGDASPHEGGGTLTCSEYLRIAPNGPAACAPADEGKACTQGCLACRCVSGQWGPCTTDPSCFKDAGTD